MLNAVDKINLLSGEMEALLDFIAADEPLGEDFQCWIEENEIKIEKQAQLNIALIEYLLDGKMQDGTRVLDYYSKKYKKADKLMVNALKESVSSVFEINKVQKNGYESYSLTCEKEFFLIPLVKMVNLRGVAKGDFIRARVIEIQGEYYLLEIYEIISGLNFYKAACEAVKCMISNSKSAIFQNEAKKEKLKDTLKIIKESFEESFAEFDKNNIITTNKMADGLLDAFNKGEENLEKYIEKVDEYKFFDIKEYSNKDDFIQNAIGGFSSHECKYDVGLFFDELEGLYIIPFLGTFYKIFETFKENNFQISGSVECIREFLKSDKVPKSVIKYAARKYENFLEVINSALDTEFNSTSDVLEKFKGADEEKFSPTLVLYNSKIFGEMLGIKENEQDLNIQKVGRNDPCPCGSGKKYKKCCGALK